MYPCNIDFSLKILGLFIVIHVVGASLNKNQTSISKEAAENTTSIRSIESSDHPNYGELENYFIMYVKRMGLNLEIKISKALQHQGKGPRKNS